jgi:endonuclease/exonuclease/phosphatase family metal-dependent hydrolase
MSSALRVRIFLLVVVMLYSVMPTQVVLGQPEQSYLLKVITHNVWYGFTKKPEPRHGEWKQWMSRQSPDVVSLQELNGFSQKDLAEDAASWGHSYSEILKKGGFPTGITSRYPISHVRRIQEGFHHGLLRCQIRGIWFYVVHFHPSNYKKRIEEAGLLKQDIMSLPGESPRVLLAGDFNAFSSEDEYHYGKDSKLISFFEQLDSKKSSARNLNHGAIDYGAIEAVLGHGFIDVVAGQRSADRPYVGTFPTRLIDDKDHGPDRRIDYIFVSPNLEESVLSAGILRDATTEVLSDHIPVVAVIDMVLE